MTMMIYLGEQLPPEKEVIPAPDAWMSHRPATDKELVALLVLVRQKIPQHVPLTDIDMAMLKGATPEAKRPLRPFKAAFTFCHQLGRTEAANRKFFSSHWGERYLDWARANSAPREPGDGFVFAAAVAQCDVHYALRSDAWSSELGFAEFGGRRTGFAPIIADIWGNVRHIEVELPWKALLRGERGCQLREPETPPQLDRDPTSVSHKYRYDHPQLWRDLEPWNPA